MPFKAKPLATVYSLSEYQLVEGQCTKEDIEESFVSLALHDRGVQKDIAGSSSVTAKVGCSSCGISSFENVAEQREHVKCDWHRYNVKMRVLGRAIVGEEEFNSMVEDDDVASISGSEDGFDDYDDYGSVVHMSTCDEEDEESGSRGDGSLAPYCIFQVMVNDGGDPQSVGFWKSLCVPDARSKQTPSTSAMYKELSVSMEKTQRWAVVMLQGGHFAAAVYELSRPSDRVLHAVEKTHGELTDLCINEIQHKSFHRYVVRAKAGGKQSDKDATGKFAVRFHVRRPAHAHVQIRFALNIFQLDFLTHVHDIDVTAEERWLSTPAVQRGNPQAGDPRNAGRLEGRPR